MRRVLNWFFAPGNRQSAWRVIAWWEIRRVPFNAVIGIYGLICLLVFFVAIESSGHLADGEDAVEPIALFLAPFGINLLYTLGWLVEVPARIIVPDLPPWVGPMLMKMGLGLGLFLITLPAAFWAGIWLLQSASR